MGTCRGSRIFAAPGPRSHGMRPSDPRTPGRRARCWAGRSDLAWKRRIIKGVPLRIFFVWIALLLAQAAHAQGWPQKPIRWLVPFPPGGSTDIATRPLAERVGQALGGHSGVVENRAGAGG